MGLCSASSMKHKHIYIWGEHWCLKSEHKSHSKASKILWQWNLLDWSSAKIAIRIFALSGIFPIQTIAQRNLWPVTIVGAPRWGVFCDVVPYVTLIVNPVLEIVSSHPRDSTILRWAGVSTVLSYNGFVQKHKIVDMERFTFTKILLWYCLLIPENWLSH